MKKRTFLAILLLGGLMMIGLAGCGENKNSREWIENKVSEVSRVYPTENLFDLFKQFPEGFEIRSIDTYDETKDYSRYQKIELVGNAETKEITGNFKRIEARGNPYEEKVLLESRIVYTEKGLEFLNPEVSKDDLFYDGFLFQKLELNKTALSRFELKKTYYNWETGDASITYRNVNSKIIQDYFHIQSSESLDLFISADHSATIGYEYGYPVVFDGENISHSELIIGKGKSMEKIDAK